MYFYFWNIVLFRLSFFVFQLSLFLNSNFSFDRLNTFFLIFNSFIIVWFTVYDTIRNTEILYFLFSRYFRFFWRTLFRRNRISDFANFLIVINIYSFFLFPTVKLHLEYVFLSVSLLMLKKLFENYLDLEPNSGNGNL